MPLLGQVLVALVIVSLFLTYLALRVQDWRYGAVAAACALPIGVIAQDVYDPLLLIPTLQIVLALALRWRVGPSRWLSLSLTGMAMWLIFAAGPYIWHWSLDLLIGYLAAFGLGPVALYWQRPPWRRYRLFSLRTS